MNIYTVTGIPWDWPNSTIRCFGWFPHFVEAQEAVEGNRGGMDEAGYYKWIVIEEVNDGVYALSNYETWFHWEDGQYRQIEKPEKFKSCVSWGIG